MSFRRRVEQALGSMAARAGAELARRLPEPVQRDWHQFRLLSRDAVRQLIDTALFSRDADSMQFALWMLALVATPTAFFASRQVLTYTALVDAPSEVVQQIALGHRLFFGVYGMLAAALLAALTWEALFPDGRDQEIVGVLPVRPRTFAAARLWAAVLVATTFTAAVNLPSAFIYTAFSVGHPLFRGHLFGLLFGHVLGTMMGSMLMFATLLILRGMAAVIFGARAGAWLGALLQLVTVVLLVEVFFFLPGVLGTLVDAVMRSDPRATAFPPVWFAALHGWMAGSREPIITTAAARGVWLFIAAAALVLPVYLVPARWLGRRALESRVRAGAGGVATLVRMIATIAAPSPPVRGIFVFAVASLLRSRHHLLILSTYLGLAIAVAIISLLIIEVRGTYALETPASWVLALPLLFMFFLVLGLRSSFRIPTEIEANWPFRLSQPSLKDSVRGTVLVMVTLAVLPIVAMTALALAPFWGPVSVLKAAVLQTMAGWLLVEAVLLNWSKVPFACGHAPSPDVLKAWWPLYTFAMYLYAFKLSDWQFLALSSGRAFAAYAGACALAVLVIRLRRRRRFKQLTLEFDAPVHDAIERLNLSEALN